MTNIGELFGIDDELAFVYFGEKSKQGNPMGSFKSLSVFAADGYRESILEGRTYYCRLERKNNQTRFYHATPLYELTLDRIMKEDPDSISKIAEIVYELDRTKFDSEISAIQMREIRNDAEQKYVDKINRLEKDNERLEKELKSREKESHTVITATNGDIDHIEGDRFYSNKLEDRYYSARLNKRKDRILLIKDDDGKYGGFGGCVDISPFKKMMNASEVKAEYCEKYSGVVISKRA